MAAAGGKAGGPTGPGAKKGKGNFLVDALPKMIEKGTQTVKRQGGGGGVVGNVKKAMTEVDMSVQDVLAFKQMPVKVVDNLGDKILDIKSKTPSSHRTKE